MGIKWPKRTANHSHSPGVGVKKPWRYTSTPPHAFIAWCAVKHDYLYLVTSNLFLISVNQLHFWVGPSRIQKAVDVMVPPHMLPQFSETVERLNLKSEVYISNVQQ